MGINSEQTDFETWAITFAGIARQLARAGSVDETLQLVVGLAREHIDGCEAVGISLVDRDRLSTPFFAGDLALQADQIQYEEDEGPCLSAIAEYETLTIDDLATDERWPAFARRARDLGVGSMATFRLFVERDTMGTLNMYSTRAGSFDGVTVAIGQVFASHAAVAMKAAITEAGLRRAITSRDMIGQAKGVLMERQELTADGAFDALRRLSQARNVPLRDIADEVARASRVPAADVRSGDTAAKG